MNKNFLGLSAAALLLGLSFPQGLGAVTISSGLLGAIAGPFTSSGTLANQGVVFQATFSISSAAQLTIYTTSYGGGANANGPATSNGGFMPSIVLYNASGNYVAGEIFPSPIGTKDPVTMLVGDAYIKTSTLAAGSYILALSDFLVQQSPSATNLSDGFIDYGSGTTFSDVAGNLRSGAYTLNITGVTGASPVPEPATVALFVPALGVLAFFARKRKSATSAQSA